VNWILSVVIDCSLAYYLLGVLFLFDLLHLRSCRIPLREKVCSPTEWLTCRLILASQVTLKTTFSTKWPPHTYAEGGQVEPVLAAFCDEQK
jgi:hypothetical protein